MVLEAIALKANSDAAWQGSNISLMGRCQARNRLYNESSTINHIARLPGPLCSIQSRLPLWKAAVDSTYSYPIVNSSSVLRDHHDVMVSWPGIDWQSFPILDDTNDTSHQSIVTYAEVW